MILHILPETLAVCRLGAHEAIPVGAIDSSFFTISRTSDELSVVCWEHLVPPDVRAERGWRCFRVQGPIDFGVTGVLSSLVGPLAEKKIGIFAISTFDTDYLLVKSENFESAAWELFKAGHEVRKVKNFDPDFHQPSLTTARLSLEPVTEAYAEELFAMYNHPDILRYISIKEVSLELQKDRCARWAKRISPSGESLWLNWLARDLKTGAAVAHFQAGLDAHQMASLGYVVDKKFQRQGFAFEALKTIINYLKTNFKIHRIQASTDIENIASRKLVVKLGLAHTETQGSDTLFNLEIS